MLMKETGYEMNDSQMQSSTQTNARTPEMSRSNHARSVICSHLSRWRIGGVWLTRLALGNDREVIVLLPVFDA